ncbi:hypothetical protein BpHYR1_039289 [Brachionus plicatilis]|uniref:Uncharacterized protein n=1 Tax=Brachionus plicatilis TaxID=10195 RepID=A0A3M7PU83_BRAPC|nr:hypothetical protein BpHYR1_039289 [Brachionus plicatilis]
MANLLHLTTQDKWRQQQLKSFKSINKQLIKTQIVLEFSQASAKVMPFQNQSLVRNVVENFGNVKNKREKIQRPHFNLSQNYLAICFKLNN